MNLGGLYKIGGQERYMVESFSKIVNGFQRFTIFTKYSIINVSHGTK